MHPTSPIPLMRSAPEPQGVPSQAILDFVIELEAARTNMHSLMLLRHGQVIAEGWWSPFKPGHRCYLYSLSKSFTSTAVGLAVAEGLLSVEDRVVSFFPQELPAKVGDNLAAMRVRHLLTMSTGHAVDTTDAILLPGGNWARNILSLPVDYPPGAPFVYNSGASYLLSAIVQKVSGGSLVDYLTPRLFEPLGIENVTWDVCPRGINTGGWGLSLATEEIARFGQLYLQNGAWDGRQLLPVGWVQQAGSAQVRNDGPDRVDEPIDWRQGYGYQFWRCQHGAYRGDGAFGQFCVVMPEQDAVLAITSETADMQAILDRVWECLLPAMKSGQLPPDPSAHDRLKQKLTSLEMDLPPSKPHPETAAGISGQKFVIARNADGVRAVRFTFTPNSCHFQLWDRDGEHQVESGNGAWIENETAIPCMHLSMMHVALSVKAQPIQMAANGAWTDAHTYVMTWQYLETPHSDKVVYRFSGDEVHIEVSTSMADANNPDLAEIVTHYSGRVNVNSHENIP